MKTPPLPIVLDVFARRRIFPAAALFFLLSVSLAGAAEVTVQNDSDYPAKLYSTDGSGWHYEATLPAGSRSQRIASEPGIDWGFADPTAHRLDIVKRITVKTFGFNTLTLTNRDLGPSGGGGGDPGLLERSITVTNRASVPVDVYFDHGHGWEYEITLPSGASRKLAAQDGDDWGVDNPAERGVNILKSTTIKAWNPVVVLNVDDDDLGIDPGHRHGPGSGPRDRRLTIVNRSHHPAGVFSNAGPGWTRKGSIDPGESLRFEIETGQEWGVGRSQGSRVDLFKTMAPTRWGANVLAFGDEDLPEDIRDHDRGWPGDRDRDGNEVTVTFENRADETAYIYQKIDPLGLRNELLTTVPRDRSVKLDLVPGMRVVVKLDGPLPVASYTIPTSRVTYRIGD
ncbi:MAG: hypothetical protein KDM91_01645 [Verrucomicrobiae bacterium]|nr:hypothetical protein [Verrucomicrobiae bacterium]MCP5539299.1 hypothetical protein [Akkermansiaceae bacterium]